METRDSHFFTQRDAPEEWIKKRLVQKIQNCVPGMLIAFQDSGDTEMASLVAPLADVIRFGRLHIVVANTAEPTFFLPPIEFANIPNTAINPDQTRRLKEIGASEPKLQRAIVIHDREFVRSIFNDPNSPDDIYFDALEPEERRKIVLPFVMAGVFFRTMIDLESGNPWIIRNILTGDHTFANRMYDVFTYYAEKLDYSIKDREELFPASLHEVDFGLEDFMQAVDDKLRNTRQWDLTTPNLPQIITYFKNIQRMHRNKTMPYRNIAECIRGFIELRALYLPLINNIFRLNPQVPDNGAQAMVELIVNKHFISPD